MIRATPSFLTLLLAALTGLLAFAQAGPAHAQLPTRATMPDPVVLVLRTLGEDQFQPTGGVVVGRANTGDWLVVVPTEFVAAEGDIFVLASGTDLSRDGLPARRRETQEGEPLAVISVAGLERPAIRVTFNPPETDHEVRLAAWPPAEMMATGAQPFWIPVSVAGAVTGQPQTLMPGQDLPNLTGPLIDLCGQWAGMVIATGEPGINADQQPQVVLNDAVLRVAQNLNIDLSLEACMQVAPVGGTVASTTAAPSTSERSGVLGGIKRALESANLGIGALVFLLSAVISGIVFWVLIKRRAATQRRQRMQRTLATETVTFSAEGLPTRRTAVEAPTFNPGTSPPGSTGWLRIEGKHADGRPLRAVTAIHDGKFQAVIGRAGVPLSADGPGISRKHAVIVGEGAMLTISDLGSRNGTFVNGVRCQKDEVFYIKEGDQILLGAAEVTVRTSPVKGPIR